MQSLKKNKKILFISKGKESASTRYRAFAYFEHFKSSGWEPKHLEAKTNLISRFRMLQLSKNADAVVIIRKTFPLQFLKILRAFSKVIIFDFDDAVFCHSDGTFSKTRTARFTQTVKMCERIWAGNRYLRETAKRHNPFVSLIPTSVDMSKYTARGEKPDTFFDLVWIGSGSTKKYIEFGIPFLESLAKRFPQLRLKIVADFNLHIPGLNVIPVQWCKDKEAQDIAASHVGIAPMPDNEWTRGKCGLKILQYMAAGLPVISSPSGVNAEIVQHGETGFLANSESGWIEAVEAMSKNPALRNKMGEAGKSRVENYFSTQSTFQKILYDLENL